jgi:hypothetical protein
MLILGDQSDSARRAADNEKRPCSPKGSLFALNPRVSNPQVSLGLYKPALKETPIWSKIMRQQGQKESRTLGDHLGTDSTLHSLSNSF